MAAGFRQSQALENKVRSPCTLSAGEESAGRRTCSAEREAGRRRNSRPILSADRYARSRRRRGRVTVLLDTATKGGNHKAVGEVHISLERRTTSQRAK
jgi:hypothetical protein